MAASAAATVARPKATSHGSRSATASRVAGSENEKPMMPSEPSTRPGGSARAPARRGAVAVTGFTAIALSALLMLNDNAQSRVIQDLRASAAARSPGERLPSVRELMARHRASPVTVQRAIAALAAEGLVEPRPGRGTFVAPRAPAQAPPDLSWQAVALGERAVDDSTLQDLLALPPPG